MSSANRYEFHIVDVFAERRFGGNQLAVLPDARGLQPDAMQRIAREFNFAESTFVFPAEQGSHTARVRIFTPGVELPFAGHPTVGTAAVLASLGRGESRGAARELVLELGIGPVPVTVRSGPRGPEARFTVEGPFEQHEGPPANAALAEVLSLPATAVQDAWFAARGTRFLFVKLDSSRSVDAAALDQRTWRSTLGAAWSSSVYFFAGDPTRSANLYARMFAPGLGVTEDPATGSAAAILAGTMASRAGPGAAIELVIDQGVAMGRASLLRAIGFKDARGAVRAEVSGSVQPFARGTLELE